MDWLRAWLRGAFGFVILAGTLYLGWLGGGGLFGLIATAPMRLDRPAPLTEEQESRYTDLTARWLRAERYRLDPETSLAERFTGALTDAEEEELRRLELHQKTVDLWERQYAARCSYASGIGRILGVALVFAGWLGVAVKAWTRRRSQGDLRE